MVNKEQFSIKVESQEISIRKELQEIRAMLYKQHSQYKRLMVLSIVNVYVVVGAIVFVSLFLK